MAGTIVFEETVSYLLAKVTTAYRTAVERHIGTIKLQSGPTKLAGSARQRAESTKLHGGEAFVLIELWGEDGPRQIDLARRLSIAAPTLTKMLNALQKKELVERIDEPGDGRSVRVFLTKKGRDIRTEVERRWIDLEAECLTALNETERLVLLEVLRKLRTTYTGRKDAVDEE